MVFGYSIEDGRRVYWTYWPSVHVGYMSAFLEEVTCRHIMEDDSID